VPYDKLFERYRFALSVCRLTSERDLFTHTHTHTHTHITYKDKHMTYIVHKQKPIKR